MILATDVLVVASVVSDSIMSHISVDMSRGEDTCSSQLPHTHVVVHVATVNT